MMKTPASLLPLFTSVAALALLAACERAPSNAQFPADAERLQAAAEAAARATQVITTKLGETYGTNQAINVHVQVGDIVVLGFDEGVDAEEWGMTEYSGNAPQGSAKTPQSAAIQADQAPATAGKRKIARSIDLRKGAIYLIASEESEALEANAPAEPVPPAPVQKAGQ